MTLLPAIDASPSNVGRPGGRPDAAVHRLVAPATSATSAPASAALRPPTTAARAVVYGRATSGRPLLAELFGPAEAPVRVAVVAGQHGDEPLGPAAAERARDRLRALGAASGGLRIALITAANPDGLAVGRRTTGAGRDANRDHVSLETPEIRALHELLSDLRPWMVLDVHAFPTRRTWMLQHGLVHAADVCLDWTASPAAAPLVRQEASAIGRQVLGELDDAGWRASRYVVASGRGVVRPSSGTPATLLNAAALRHGARGLIIEARAPGVGEPPASHERGLEATADAIVRAVAAAVRGVHAARRPEDGSVHAAGADDGPEPVAIDAAWVRDDLPHELWVRPASGGSARRAASPGRWRSALVPTRHVRPAAAYGIPARAEVVHDQLDRSGVPRLAGAPHGGHVEVATVDQISTTRGRPFGFRRISATWAPMDDAAEVARRLGEPVIWRLVTPATARFLAAILEPEARFGVVREGLVPWRPAPGAVMPIARCAASPPTVGGPPDA